jgi:hypothetical protein
VGEPQHDHRLIVPIMLTFAVLTVSWGLAAIGLRRLA